MVKFYIPGKLPGFNEYSNSERSTRFAASETKRRIEDRIANTILAQVPGIKFYEPVVILFHWFETDKKRDKDNIAFAKKFILDALQKAGTLRGDGWNHVESFQDCFTISDRSYITVKIWGLTEWLEVAANL